MVMFFFSLCQKVVSAEFGAVHCRRHGQKACGFDGAFKVVAIIQGPELLPGTNSES
jgi:hypothetical protein